MSDGGRIAEHMSIGVLPMRNQAQDVRLSYPKVAWFNNVQNITEVATESVRLDETLSPHFPRRSPGETP